MKALLLAAGLGSRLKPVTDTIPKCLVPINGKPLLEFWLEMLSHAGVDQFYINIHYHADAVRQYVEGSPFKSRTTLIEEAELLGTGGTLKKNANLFLDESFFLAHADNLCLTDFRAFIEAHKNRPAQAEITMMTFHPVDARQCGVVTVNDKNIVTGFYEKVENPPTQLANGAVFMMEPEVADFAKKTEKDIFEISLDVLPSYVGKMLTCHNADYHVDIGTPQTYQKAQDEKEIIDALYKKYMR